MNPLLKAISRIAGIICSTHILRYWIPHTIPRPVRLAVAGNSARGDPAMNRSLNCILTVILIACVLCGALAPAASAGFVVQTTTQSLKPSSCYSAPKYPGVSYGIQYTGAVESGTSGLYDNPPYTVSFTDRSVAPSGQPITSWYWDFGDGATSTSQNTVHSYDEPGAYSVRQKVTTVCGSDYSKEHSFFINIQCSEPVAGFRTDVTEGTAPLTVHITDTSGHTPPEWTTWKYTYGKTDGLLIPSYAHVRNPTIILTDPGTYRIVQQVEKRTSSSAPSQMRGRVLTDTVSSVEIRVLFAAVGAYSSGENSSTSYYMDPALVLEMVTPTPSPTNIVTVTTETLSTAQGTSAVTGTSSGSSPEGISTQGSSAQGNPAGTAPQTAPAVPGTGTLSVTTNPAGALVWIDEVKWGVSPAAIPGITAGAHTLRLEKAGYQNLSVPVTVSEGKTAEYSLALEPLAGSGSGILPLIVGAVIVVGLAGAGAYFFMKKKKAP